MEPLIIGYILLILAQIIREGLRIYFAAGKRPEKISDHGSKIFIIIYFVILFLSPTLRLLNSFNFNLPFLSMLGIVLMAGGIIIHIIAMAQLNKYFSGVLMISQKHKLMTKGLYSFSRHPGYLGSLLIALGFSLTIGNTLAILLIIVSYIVVYGHRMKVEEEMLQKAFGEEYRMYKEKTRKLMPYIY